MSVASEPHPALARLDKLVGTWTLTGRTLDSTVDNIHGRVTIEWLPGGFFQVQRGEIEMTGPGLKVHSLEVIGYDPARRIFRSHVYSSLGEWAAPYQWDVQGNVVTHWTEGSKYTGSFSEDGNTLSGGWRPEEAPASPGNAYDATMIRMR